jgi:hypothetical protein
MAKKEREGTCKIPRCNLYAVTNGLCIYHSNMEVKKKAKEVDPFNIHGFTKLYDFYKYIWSSRIHKCYVTNKKLDWVEGTSYERSVFLHILPKSKYVEFKYYENNIVVGSPLIHHLFDNAILEDILEFEQENNCTFQALFELEQHLFQEYKTAFKKTRVLRKITQNYLEFKR